jgi:hypothetical protein
LKQGFAVSLVLVFSYLANKQTNKTGFLKVKIELNFKNPVIEILLLMLKSFKCPLIKLRKFLNTVKKCLLSHEKNKNYKKFPFTDEPINPK